MWFVACFFKTTLNFHTAFNSIYSFVVLGLLYAILMDSDISIAHILTNWGWVTDMCIIRQNHHWFKQRLFDVNPLSEPMMACQWTLMNICVEVSLKSNVFTHEKCHLTWRPTGLSFNVSKIYHYRCSIDNSCGNTPDAITLIYCTCFL